MPKRKAPNIPATLTLDETLKLQAADLVRHEGKALYRFHKSNRIHRAGISQSLIDMKRKYKHDPPEVLQFVRRAATRLDTQTNAMLEIYGDQHVPTRWMRAVGVGIEQCVGLFSHIDIEKCHRVSSLWRYCGYDPNTVKLTKQEAGECIRYFQEKYPKEYPDEEVIRSVAMELNRGPQQLLRITRVGTRRDTITWGQLYKAILSYPWNQEVKEILYRLGISFRRVGGRGLEVPPYRSVYEWRKAYEIERNEQGDYAEQAAERLEARNWKKSRTAYKHYVEGRLPPLHIDARARRFAIKIFLVHLHQVMFYGRYGKMPEKPYVLAVLGKEHEIICPKWPYK